MGHRACPYCKKNIQHTATICGYCQKQVPTVSFWKTGLGVFIILIFVAFGIVMYAQVSALKPHTVSNIPIKLKKPAHPAPFKAGQKITVSGVENGRLEVPYPNLWQNPGGMSTQGQRVRTTIKSGTRVQVVGKSYTSSGRWFFNVETYGANKGKAGWISESLLKP